MGRVSGWRMETGREGGEEMKWQTGVMDRNGKKRKSALHGAMCTGCITNVSSEERALKMPSPGDGGQVLRTW